MAEGEFGEFSEFVNAARMRRAAESFYFRSVIFLVSLSPP